jgi:hypothetical protein
VVRADLPPSRIESQQRFEAQPIDRLTEIDHGISAVASTAKVGPNSDKRLAKRRGSRFLVIQANLALCCVVWRVEKVTFCSKSHATVFLFSLVQLCINLHSTSSCCPAGSALVRHSRARLVLWQKVPVSDGPDDTFAALDRPDRIGSEECDVCAAANKQYRSYKLNRSRCKARPECERERERERESRDRETTIDDSKRADCSRHQQEHSLFVNCSLRPSSPCVNLRPLKPLFPSSCFITFCSVSTRFVLWFGALLTIDRCERQTIKSQLNRSIKANVSRCVNSARFRGLVNGFGL